MKNKKFGLFFLPPPPTSLKHELYGLTSSFTRLIMQIKYVCQDVISLHVNFYDNRTKWTVTSNIKICRWGGKGKRAKVCFRQWRLISGMDVYILFPYQETEMIAIDDQRGIFIRAIYGGMYCENQGQVSKVHQFCASLSYPPPCTSCLHYPRVTKNNRILTLWIHMPIQEKKRIPWAVACGLGRVCH